MFSARNLVLPVLLGAALLAGCGTSANPAAPAAPAMLAVAPVAPTQAPETAPAKAGLTVQVGQEVIVSLEGRQWSPPTVDGTLLAWTNQDAPVTEGFQLWVYKALAPGQTTITSRGICRPDAPCDDTVLVYQARLTIVPRKEAAAAAPLAPVQAATAATYTVEGKPARPLRITQADSGRHLTLKVGERLAVQLVGRMWTAPAGAGKVLQALPTDVPQTTGVYYWEYRAVAPGAVTLTSTGPCLAGSTRQECAGPLAYKIAITITR